jgi:signal transduction histidine kinase/PAS domain-containing protein
VAALGATLIAATLGTASLVLGGQAPPADAGPIWLTWWLGDAAGALIVAPPLILWSQPPRTPGKAGRALEAGLMLLALAGLGLLVFGGWAPLAGRHLPLEFLILPLVTWAAFRFGRRGAAAATLILASIAVWGTIQGHGPFALGAAADSLLLLQAFMATIAHTGLGIAAVVSERRQSELSLRLSRDELAVILQGAADGVIAQDGQGKIHYANEAAARLMGYPNTAAVLSAPPAERRARFAVYDEAGHPMDPAHLPGRTALREGRHAAATVRYVETATGAERWSADQATPILDDAGQVRLVINILHDITDLKRTELHQRLLAEAGRTLVAAMDPDAQLAAVAQLLVPHLADWCALHVMAEDGTLYIAAVANADAARAAQAGDDGRRSPRELASGSSLAEALASGQSLLIPDITDETLLRNARDPGHLEQLRAGGLKSAMVVPLKAHGRSVGVLTMIWAESGRRYGEADLRTAEELARLAALAADHARLYRQAQSLNAELEERVRQRTQALELSQGQARALSARLLAVREEERTEMAREIHDELGQQLTGIKMALARVARALPASEEADEQRGRLQTASDEVDATIQTVRRLATRLRPSLLDDFGLITAVEAHLQDFQERTGITGKLNAKATALDLEPETSTALFRVCQEALTNVARHAGASQVQICFDVRDQELLVQIQDDGRGISEQELTNNHSLGLAGMRERVLLIGGQIAFSSAPGEGTTLRVTVPIDGGKDKGE